MRLPNGFGSVYKLSGNRRRPWIARKTTGWTAEGKQLYYTVGYHETRTAAINALVEYNKNPIGKRGDITLNELYVEWSASKYPKIKESTSAGYTSAYKHMHELKDVAFEEIRTSHLQAIADSMLEKNMSLSAVQKVKVLAGQLYRYAMADDIVAKNYASFMELPDTGKAKTDYFTDLEIQKLEELAQTDKWAGTILMLIYTGFRIGEFLALTKFSVDLDQGYIRGGSKTEAGMDRIVPIHPKILKYVKYWYDKPGEYLIARNTKQIRAEYYRIFIFYPLLERNEMRRLTPHAARHTFATMLDRSGASPKVMQELLGHADYSTTSIYTHPDLETLSKTLRSI